MGEANPLLRADILSGQNCCFSLSVDAWSRLALALLATGLRGHEPLKQSVPCP